MTILDILISHADAFVALLLPPVTVWVLLSGVDDLILDIVALLRSVLRKLGRFSWETPPTRAQLEATPEKLVAIFTPLWQEDSVISRMIEQNTASVRYSSHQFFLGAYPNDHGTLSALEKLEELYPRVHIARCPHNGPTSKADCLNWIYQRMLEFEREHSCRFEVIVTHDAEDVIHPDALRWINFYSRQWEMVQIPVLPIPTPMSHWTHGLYCDEFSEFQVKDMPARQYMGSFIPSNGVGTGFSRSALERLAQNESNRIFEPACLTEDYENGIRLHYLAASQMFVPLRPHGPITREYFPLTFRAAIRQRTRWITGIALQTWERHGWHGSPAVKYWLWRDRKCLLGAPVGLLATMLFGYGVITWSLSELTGGSWTLLEVTPAGLQPLLAVTSVLTAIRTGVRTACVGRFFGWRFACGVPIRMLLGNAINSAAAFGAIFRFGRAKLKGQPLVWLKTEHQFPSQLALQPERQLLGAILVGGGFVSPEQLTLALTSRGEGERLGERLIEAGALDEDALYQALQIQTGLPVATVSAPSVRVVIARALPAEVAQRCRVIPFKVESGCLFLATPDVPTEETHAMLRPFTNLDLRFQLMKPAKYRELASALMGKPAMNHVANSLVQAAGGQRS